MIAELAKNRLWEKLPAVQEDRSHAFPEGIWTFGGPRSAKQILDAYVDCCGRRRPLSVTRRAAVDQPAAARGRGSARAADAVLGLLAWSWSLVSGWHLTQGTSGRPATCSLATGTSTRIVLASRAPARGRAGRRLRPRGGGSPVPVAGAQRDGLAGHPGGDGGAFFAVTVVAAFGLAVPLWASGLVAFVGGLAAAVLVLALAGGAGTSTTRLILAGSATALALRLGHGDPAHPLRDETTGLFAWGNGTLSQLDLRAFVQAAPAIVLATVVALLAGPSARPARPRRRHGVGARRAGTPHPRAGSSWSPCSSPRPPSPWPGPIGFVGLCAPAVARLAARVVPALHRHGVLIPASGLLGALLVVGADAAMRAVLGPERALAIPTGVTTTLLGAIVLVVLARRARDSGPTRQPPAARVGGPRPGTVRAGRAGHRGDPGRRDAARPAGGLHLAADRRPRPLGRR